jgi:hypothetical protein
MICDLFHNTFGHTLLNMHALDGLSPGDVRARCTSLSSSQSTPSDQHYACLLAMRRGHDARFQIQNCT